MRMYIKHTRPTAGYRFRILPVGARKNIVIACIVGALSGYLAGYLGTVVGAEIAWEKPKGVQRVFELGGASIGIVLGYHVSFRWMRRKYIGQDEVHGEQTFDVTSDHIIPSNGLLIPRERIRRLFIREEKERDARPGAERSVQRQPYSLVIEYDGREFLLAYTLPKRIATQLLKEIRSILSAEGRVGAGAGTEFS